MSVMPDFVSCTSTLLPFRQKVAELAEASPASDLHVHPAMMLPMSELLKPWWCCKMSFGRNCDTKFRNIMNIGSSMVRSEDYARRRGCDIVSAMSNVCFVTAHQDLTQTLA